MPAAFAEEDPDATEWWVRVTTENAPVKFHLLPDDSEQPRDWLGLLRDTGFIIGYQVVGAAILYRRPGERLELVPSEQGDQLREMVGERFKPSLG